MVISETKVGTTLYFDICNLHEQASTLTSVILPKRTKIINDGQFSKSIRQKTDENHQGLVLLLLQA